jgi:hypothetical protein
MFTTLHINLPPGRRIAGQFSQLTERMKKFLKLCTRTLTIVPAVRDFKMQYFKHELNNKKTMPNDIRGHIYKYKVVQIWPGQTVTNLHTISPGHIWTTLYLEQVPAASVVMGNEKGNVRIK